MRDAMTDDEAKNMRDAMTDGEYPKYEVKSIAGYTNGWCVILTRKNGHIETLYGFRDEADARTWVGRRRTQRQT